jgi:hypothetical protein
METNARNLVDMIGGDQARALLIYRKLSDDGSVYDVCVCVDGRFITLHARSLQHAYRLLDALQENVCNF